MPNRRNNNVIEDGPSPHLNPVEDDSVEDFSIRLASLEGEGIEAQINHSQVTEENFSRTFQSLTDMVRNEERRMFFGTSPRTVTINGNTGRLSGSNPFSVDGTYTSKVQEKPLVEQDPESTVTLRNGNSAKLEDCACIFGKYYLKTDKEITKDYFEPERYIRKEDCSSVNVTFDNDGYLVNKVDLYDPRFTKRNTIVEVKDGRMHVMSDYNAIPKQFYTECISTNIWYHNSIAGKNVDTEKRMKVRARKTTNIYKLSPFKPNLKKDYEMGIKSPSFIKTEGKRYTYGIEMETISGKLPLYLDDQLNYLAIRDGSLKDDDGEEYGYEYVTGVLTGDTGLLQTKKLCNALTKYCIVNKKCG